MAPENGRGIDKNVRKVQARKYGIVSAETLTAQDGLSFLQGILNGTEPSPPVNEVLGLYLTEAYTGGVVFAWTPQSQHYNLIGTVHGGIAAALLDSALGCAIFSTLKAGESWTTLELKVNFVRAITKESGLVRAEGRVIHRGRTVATSEGDIKDSLGRLYAHGTTTCMIFQRGE